MIGQIEKSIEVLLKAYSLEQNNQNVLENLAELYRIKGDEKASKKYFDKAQKIQNNFEEKVRPQTPSRPFHLRTHAPSHLGRANELHRHHLPNAG